MGRELYIGEDGKDDVRWRLVDTICRYKGEPVYVRGSQSHMLTIQYLTRGRDREIVDYRIPEFDYSAPPLGYMNVDRSARYISRVPSRENQKQGLSRIMLQAHDGFDVQNYALTAEFRSCVLGEHRTLEQALEDLEQAWESVAIARHVAIRKLGAHALAIDYRGRMVGLREQGRWRLLDSPETSIILPFVRRAGVPC